MTDPGVVAALKEGRSPSDIALLICPDCGQFGYYNQGSHFFCRRCDKGFSVVTPEELVSDLEPVGATIVVDEIYTLADVLDAAPDGY